MLNKKSIKIILLSCVLTEPIGAAGSDDRFWEDTPSKRNIPNPEDQKPVHIERISLSLYSDNNRTILSLRPHADQSLPLEDLRKLLLLKECDLYSVEEAKCASGCWGVWINYGIKTVYAKIFKHYSPDSFAISMRPKEISFKTFIPQDTLSHLKELVLSGPITSIEALTWIDGPIEKLRMITRSDCSWKALNRVLWGESFLLSLETLDDCPIYPSSKCDLSRMDAEISVQIGEGPKERREKSVNQNMPKYKGICVLEPTDRILPNGLPISHRFFDALKNKLKILQQEKKC